MSVLDEATQVEGIYAEVLAADAGDDWRLRDETGAVLHARRAVGCLLEPRAGDGVLLSPEFRGRRYILSVLERPATPGAGHAPDGEKGDEAAARLLLPGDGELLCPGGSLRIAARDGIDLTTPEAVAVAGGTVRVRTEAAEMVARRMSVAGESMHVTVRALRTCAASLDSVIDRVHQRFKRLTRRTEGAEDLRAGRVTQIVDRVFNLRAHYSSIVSKTITKVDGDQVQLG